MCSLMLTLKLNLLFITGLLDVQKMVCKNKLVRSLLYKMLVEFFPLEVYKSSGKQARNLKSTARPIFSNSYQNSVRARTLN